MSGSELRGAPRLPRRMRHGSASSTVVAVFLALGCAGSPPATLGLAAGRLAPCPDRPNCVSSGMSGAAHVAPFPLGSDPSVGWERIVAAVRALPRTVVVREDAGYVHAESRSTIFGFVDDLELQRDDALQLVQVRSASRLGYADLGVNRARVEALRAAIAR